MVGQRAQRSVVKDTILKLQANRPVVFSIIFVFKGIDNSAVWALNGHLDAVAEVVVLIGASLVESLAASDLLDQETTVVISIFHRADSLLVTGIVNYFLALKQVVVVVAVFAHLGRHTIDIVVARLQHQSVVAQLLTAFQVERIGICVRCCIEVSLGQIDALIVLCFGKQIDVGIIATVFSLNLVAFTHE